MATATVEELWGAHLEKDPVARERLILQYAPLVKYVAGRLAISLPAVLDSEDLLGAGMMGLIRAVEHYEPSRGVPFENYSISCIRGAILDQLRALDVISRTARQRAKEIERVTSTLQAELGRAPRDGEVAAAMGMDITAYGRALREASPATISLDADVGGDADGEPITLLATVKDPSSPNPEHEAEQKELLEELAEAISGLSDREQLLLSLYYREELTMKEISLVMNISESRVCQIHTRAVLRLRTQLRLEHQSDR